VFNQAIGTPILKTAISVIQAEILALTYLSFICLLEFAEWLMKAQFRKLMDWC